MRTAVFFTALFAVSSAQANPSAPVRPGQHISIQRWNFADDACRAGTVKFDDDSDSANNVVAKNSNVTVSAPSNCKIVVKADGIEIASDGMSDLERKIGPVHVVPGVDTRSTITVPNPPTDATIYVADFDPETENAKALKALTVEAHKFTVINDVDISNAQHTVVVLAPKNVALTFQTGQLFSVPKGQRLRFELATPPPTRLHGSIDGTDGSHVEVEWDPSQPTGLTRTVSLPTTAATVLWRVSFAEDPIIWSSSDPQGGKSHYMNARFTTWFGVDSKTKRPGGVATGHFGDLFDSASEKTNALADVTIQITVDDLPSLKTRREALSATSGEGGRSLQDAVPQAVSDLFSILAEIAIERARAKAFELITNIITNYACNLKAIGVDGLAKQNEMLLPLTCSALKHVRVQDLAGAAKTLLRALFGDAVHFGIEFATDWLVAQLDKSPTLHEWAPLGRALLEPIEPVLVSLARGDTQLSGREAHLVVMRLAAVDWYQRLNSLQILKPGLPTEQADQLKAIGCGLNLLFAAVSECHSAGTCDARRLADMIDNAGKYFSQDDCVKFAGEKLDNDQTTAKLIHYWPDIHQYASRVLDLLTATRATDPRTMLRSAIGLVFDVLNQLFQVQLPSTYLDDLKLMASAYKQLAPLKQAWDKVEIATNGVNGCKGDDQCTKANEELAKAQKQLTSVQKSISDVYRDHAQEISPNSDTRKLIQAALKDMRGLVDGVIEGDVQPVLIAAADFFEQVVAVVNKCEDDSTHCQKIKKVTALVGALASYAATYVNDPKADAKAIQEQHDARKRAIESLIDAATERSNRDGDWVFSIGANVGLGSGGQFLAKYDWASSGSGYPQLELNMGLALQALPNRRLGVPVGGHFQLSLIDLGQFVAYSDDNNIAKAYWANFVEIGTQIGIILGSPTSNVIIGAEARWSPGLFSGTAFDLPGARSAQGAVRVGAFVSYYVPFFDFN